MIRIDVLPDDVLLEIFDFYVKEHSIFLTKTEVETWHSLVHVCQRWRSLVFGSPHRLDLQLFCTPRTPSRDILNVWPALPLIIYGSMNLTSGIDNIIIALGHSNRVCEIHLFETETGRGQLENVLGAMQVPFPELTELRLRSRDETPPVIPDSFLGGSAPRLQGLKFNGIPFPGLPNLLSSATHLVDLDLHRIPHSGYISPEAMVALLSVLSSLERLYLQFESPQSRPDLESRRPPPLNRVVIPSLTLFVFKGVSEYLEDLVICIDAPRCHCLEIIFFNQIDFDTPRLAQFISRTPIFRPLDEAYVQFQNGAVGVELKYNSSHVISRIQIPCREPDWQLSSIAQICNSLPPVKGLYITGLVWKNDAIENPLWLELLLPFTAVKSLHLHKDLAPVIAATLQELVGARITEVLPCLRNIFVRGCGFELQRPFREHIGQFVAARQLSGHPVTISVWKDNGASEFVPLTAENVEN